MNSICGYQGARWSVPKVVSFINYKGGVAKTTSTYHVGCWLAYRKGKRVLLIDIDPQTNLTFLCAPVQKWEKRRRSVGTIATLYRRYADRKPLDVKRYIWRRPIRLPNGEHHPRLDLIPCDIELIGEDLGVGSMTGDFKSMEMLKNSASAFIRDRTFLSKVIQEVEDDYDIVLIDCPPNLYLMTHNALVASDHYIVTAIPDHLSTIGLNILKNKVGKIGSMIDSAAALAGIPPNTYTPADFGAILFVRVRIGGDMVTTAHADTMTNIRSAHRCFDTHTTELIGYTEAATNSVPVWFHHSDNARRARLKMEYPRVVDEMLETLETNA